MDNGSVSRKGFKGSVGVCGDYGDSGLADDISHSSFGLLKEIVTAPKKVRMSPTDTFPGHNKFFLTNKTLQI